MDNLFHHPNVGPFVARLLIQRFTTSNPSPAYIGRVAADFADNGSGVRRDMTVVITAILLDPDALLRRLDLVLTGGTLRPHNLLFFREAMNRLGTNSVWDWPKERVATAIQLIVASPEFAVQR